MVGAPGAGKTRFALQFAETFSAPFIDDQPLRACATLTIRMNTQHSCVAT